MNWNKLKKGRIEAREVKGITFKSKTQGCPGEQMR